MSPLSTSLSKILVIKFRSLGDTVILTAALQELHRTFPLAEIHVAVFSSWAPLLEGIPGVHKIWAFDKRDNRIARARGLARLAFSLAKERYDCAVNLHASPSSSALALATRAKIRSIHFHGHRHRNRYSTVTIPGKGLLKPIIERDMDTLRALGMHIPAGRLPQISVQPKEMREAQKTLDALGLNAPILGLALGASRPTKSWPLDRFSSLATDWILRTGGSVVALSSASEPHALQFLNLLDDHLNATLHEVELRSQVRL